MGNTKEQLATKATPKNSGKFVTRINLSDNIKTSVITELNILVADLANLALITKQAHWNLKGANFIAIHEMLDGFRDTLLEHQDTFAERIVQLGGVAHGTLEDIAKATTLKPYPANIYHLFDHLNELAERYGVVANIIRKLVDTLKDENSVDMLVGASKDMDKFLWFIESHLHQ